MARAIEILSTRAFWSRMGEKAAENRIPFEAMIELTYGCNLRCVHCFNPTHQAKNELATEQITAILDQLAGVGCFYVGFTGGEIFTRKDVFGIFAHAKAQGFAITILTNATLITPERADRIHALQPHTVEVSIYGATQETYERVTRVRGSFNHFLTGVQLLRERAIPLIIKMPVMTLNQHEVLQAKALVEGWGLRFVYSTDMTPRVDGSLEPLGYRLSPEAVVQVEDLMQVQSRWRAEGGGEQEGGCQGQAGLFTCKCGKSTMAVTPYGRMNLCVSFPTPQFDLHAGSVAEGWKTLVDLVDRANAAPGEGYECPACPVQRECRQGPVDAWLETGRLEPCLPYYKELATLEKQVSEAVNREEQGSPPDCR